MARLTSVMLSARENVIKNFQGTTLELLDIVGDNKKYNKLVSIEYEKLYGVLSEKLLKALEKM